MKFILFVFAIFLLVACNEKEDRSDIQSSGYYNGVVATAHNLATQTGLNVLKNGGNAFDAAVAVNMTLAVVYPQAGNIGGGGFMVYYTAKGESGALDFREKAPARASRNMYLNSDGEAIPNLSRKGALSVGIPGTVAGMKAIHDKFGISDWDKLLVPAINFAQNGFAIRQKEADLFNRYRDAFISENKYPVSLVKKQPWQAGDTLKAPMLALTLQEISLNGADGFYSGKVALDIVNTLARAGGLVSLNDLKNYKAVWRKPVVGYFNGYQIISMPPPSSGGIALIQLLKGFDYLRGDTLKHNSALYIHLLTELERRVYADRSVYLGDDDFYPVPVDQLLDTAYLNHRFSDIEMYKATPSDKIRRGSVEIIESFETTHFEIVDRWGNAVSITTTLNGNFGSKLFAENSGFLLNNEMDDFSIKPGVPNQFGLVGNEANSIEPNKRMLSSMTPTIVLKNDSLVLIAGTPGGATIITSVFQSVLNSLVYHLPVQEALNSTKVHAQWLPDKIYFETGKMDSLRMDSLQAMGHVLFATPRLGKLKLISRYKKRMQVACDTLRGDDPPLGF